MVIEAVMLDVDGVVIVHPDPAGWSVHLERDLGLSPALLQQAFFKPHWNDILHGCATLRERLEPVLARIAPDLPCQRLIDYWFGEDAHFDHALLSEVALVRTAGLPVHLATLQEHERARHLWETLGLCHHFDGLHYAADLGAAKPHPDFFARIEARTGLAPADLFLVDDRQDNVDGARAHGWQAALWTSGATLRGLLAFAGQRV